MEFVIQSFSSWVERAGGSGLALWLIRLTLIGALLHLALALLRRAPAAFRHLTAVSALAAMVAVSAAFVLGPAWPSFALPVRSLPAFAKGWNAADPAARDWSASSQGLGDGSSQHRVARGREAGAPLVMGGRPAIGGATEPGAAAIERTEASLPLSNLPGRATRGIPTPPVPWTSVALLVALFGAAVLAIARTVAALFMARIARAAELVEDERVLAVLAAAASRLGYRDTVRLRATGRVAVPMITGVVRPVLLVPVEALEWDAARLYPVFLHELAHLARRDSLSLLVARAATTIAWFHPLAWTVARAAHQECERACDDAVLGAGVRASDYAEELLTIARSAVGIAPFAEGTLAMARPTNLEGRLLAILSSGTRRGPVSRHARAGVGVAALALLAALTSVRVVAAPEEAAREAASPLALDPRSAGEMSPIARAYELAGTRVRSGREWFSEAKEYYDSGDYSASGEFYERAAEAGYRPATSWYNAACSFALDRQTNRALGALSNAIDSGFDDTGMIKGDDDLDSIRSDRRYRMLLERTRNTSDEEARRRSARVRWDALKSSPNAEPDQLGSVGIALMRSGSAGLAAEAFARQYAADSSASALNNKACAEAIGGQPAKALASLERSIYAGYGDGDKLADDDDLNSLRGVKEFDRLVKLADDLSLRLGWFGLKDRDRWGDEMARYQRLTREQPRAGRAWFNLGFAQLRTREAEASSRSFLRALDLGYRRRTTLYNLGCAAAQAGNDDEALRYLKRAEEAGMKLADIAPGDEDLEPLRDNPRFLELVNHWDREQRREKAEKQREREKSKRFKS